MPAESNPERVQHSVEPTPTPEGQVGVRGVSLVFERLGDREELLKNGNPVQAVTKEARTINGDAVARTPTGSFLIYPEGGLRAVEDRANDTRMIVPHKAKPENTKPR